LHTSEKIGVVQIGSKHGHAISVLSTIINNPRVNFIGLYEPDLNRRNELKKFNNFPFNKINFIKKKKEFTMTMFLQLHLKVVISSHLNTHIMH